MGADTNGGGEGSDTLQCNGGTDSYLFPRGDGVGTVTDSCASADDRLLFEGAVAPKDIWLVKNGSHLDIHRLAGPANSRQR